MHTFEYKDCTKNGEFIIYRDNAQGTYDAIVYAGINRYEMENFTSFEDAECAARLACDTEAEYMNTKTGSVDNFDGWWYTDENGIEKNAVIKGEVVEVIKINGEWELV